jgi:hypothetical protein
MLLRDEGRQGEGCLRRGPNELECASSNCGQTQPLNQVESGRFPLVYLPITRKIRQWVTRWLIGSENWPVRFGEIRRGLTSR